jgi:hypothetical protein
MIHWVSNVPADPMAPPATKTEARLTQNSGPMFYRPFVWMGARSHLCLHDGGGSVEVSHMGSVPLATFAAKPHSAEESSVAVL